MSNKQKQTNHIFYLAVISFLFRGVTQLHKGSKKIAMVFFGLATTLFVRYNTHILNKNII
jgi:hypothetical protein